LHGHRRRLDGQRDTTSKLDFVEPVRLEMEPAQVGLELQIDARCTAQADGRVAQHQAEGLSLGTEHPRVDDFQDPALLVATDLQSGRGLLELLSIAGGIAQDLSTEQAMHLLAVVHAQRPLCIDVVDSPADDPGAECNANDLIAQQVQSIPLPC